MDFLEILPKSIETKKGWPWDEETDPAIYTVYKNFPKISIITPSYNQGAYIEETIRSILLQNYPNLEYVIIDGGSTDNTIEIIKKYEPWITYWVSEKDKGQSDAINKGFEKCSGEIFNWLNSDDYYTAGSLFKVAEFFMENENTDVLAGRSTIFGINNRISEATPVFKNLSATISASRINQPATFFRLNIFKSLAPLDISMHYVMDLHVWLKYLVRNGIDRVHRIDNILVNFREHELSKTIASEMEFYKEKYFLLNNLQRKIEDNLHQEKDFFDGIIIPGHRTEDILTGINDCFLFWLRHFCKDKKNEIANILIEFINPKKLNLKSKIEYFYIKSIYKVNKLT
jgi:glycosyltransferase involved in cell wall biosynthesis